MMNSAILLKEMLVLQNAVNSCKDILYTIQAPLCSFCDICLTPLKLTADRHGTVQNQTGESRWLPQDTSLHLTTGSMDFVCYVPTER